MSLQRETLRRSVSGTGEFPCIVVLPDFFKTSVSTPVHKLSTQSRKLLVKNLYSLCLCLVFFYSCHKDINRLSGFISEHKLEHVGFNLSVG